MRTYRLRERSVLIHAPRQLVFEMASAVGGDLPGGPAHDSRLLEHDGNRQLVTYRVPVGRWAFELLEEVRLTPPERIEYRVVRGPLSRVTETLEFVTRDPASTLVSYTGSVGDDRPVVGPMLARLVAVSAYDRFMRRSLAALKSAAERRASRSKVYPPAAGE